MNDTIPQEKMIEVIQDFNELYYRARPSTWDNTTYLGRKLFKTPTDLWIMQELIYKTRPDLLIETGSYKGGSALYYAHVMDNIQHGMIATIDLHAIHDYVDHPRINYLVGDSADPDMINVLKLIIEKHNCKNIMVILDSDHSYEHVSQELELYHSLVSDSQYLIVEDTNVTLDIDESIGGSARKAMDEFLLLHPEFESDRSCEKFLLTFNPCGYLKKIK